MSRPAIPKVIGKVKIEDLSNVADREYSDGDSEDVLFGLFSSPDAEKKRLEMLENPETEWRLRYHLAYARENLLNWYTFKPGSKLLEVGSGCGAVTNVFIKGCERVDAIDISPRRSLINAHRHSSADNLRVIIGNIENLGSENSYDYVTCIGVLEYAGRFINSGRPYQSLLTQLGNQLKPGGTLILAIENKLGMKYWSGSREDHLGQVFSGIEGYPHDTGVRTFGRKELEELLASTGFSKNAFYYPMPDYKLPLDIYSDDYLPGEGGSLSSDLFPTPNPDQPREFFFSEDLAMQSVTENDLFPYFANSFLVFCTKDAS